MLNEFYILNHEAHQDRKEKYFPHSEIIQLDSGMNRKEVTHPKRMQMQGLRPRRPDTACQVEAYLRYVEESEGA
jgi:hypothetical protein